MPDLCGLPVLPGQSCAATWWPSQVFPDQLYSKSSEYGSVVVGMSSLLAQLLTAGNSFRETILNALSLRSENPLFILVNAPNRNAVYFERREKDSILLVCYNLNDAISVLSQLPENTRVAISGRARPLLDALTDTPMPKSADEFDKHVDEVFEESKDMLSKCAVQNGESLARQIIDALVDVFSINMTMAVRMDTAHSIAPKLKSFSKAAPILYKDAHDDVLVIPRIWAFKIGENSFMLRFGYEVSAVDRFDNHLDSAFTRVSQTRPITVERPVKFLN